MQNCDINTKSESSDEEQIQSIIQDFDTIQISKNIEKKYSNDAIKRFIENIYYFNSLELLGNWNIFGCFFKEMDITDCVGYFGYLKVNGYLEDVHLKKKHLIQLNKDKILILF